MPAFARRWSLSWQHIRGHESLARAFADVVQRGRLGHAYLFVGPAGVGKRLFAREFAKALLCEQPAGPLEACDRCAACKLVGAGTHPDLLQFAMPEDKHEFPINTMRELLAQMALKPARGSYKIAILDDADDFNEESANCFLKTLEEPPPKSVLILLATDLGPQLPTIVSRCQIVRFAALPAAVVAELLREQGIDAERAARLARLSGGSLGMAHDLADEELWTFRKEFIAALATPRPDPVALGRKLTDFVEAAGKESTLQRRRAVLVLKLLIDFLEAVLRFSAGSQTKDAEPDDARALQALAERLGSEGLLRLLERCLDAGMHIDRKVQLVLALEALADVLALSST